MDKLLIIALFALLFSGCSVSYIDPENITESNQCYKISVPEVEAKLHFRKQVIPENDCLRHVANISKDGQTYALYFISKNYDLYIGYDLETNSILEKSILKNEEGKFKGQFSLYSHAPEYSQVFTITPSDNTELTRKYTNNLKQQQYERIMQERKLRQTAGFTLLREIGSKVCRIFDGVTYVGEILDINDSHTESSLNARIKVHVGHAYSSRNPQWGVKNDRIGTIDWYSPADWKGCTL